MSGNDRRIKELRELIEEQTRKLELEQTLQSQHAQHDKAYAAKLMNSNPIQYNSNNINAAGSGTYFDSTGNTPYLPRRDHGAVVANIHTKHGKGFWSQIHIHEDDYIYYRLFRGSFLKRLLHKAGLRQPSHSLLGEWNAIGGQDVKDSKLEAQLGKTYLKIDELIADELKDQEHKKFIKGIAKTDPENLKMIAGLKTLDEGMTEPLDEPMNGGNSQSTTPQIVTSGSMTITSAQIQSMLDARDISKTGPQKTGKAP